MEGKYYDARTERECMFHLAGKKESRKAYKRIANWNHAMIVLTIIGWFIIRKSGVAPDETNLPLIIIIAYFTKYTGMAGFIFTYPWLIHARIRTYAYLELEVMKVLPMISQLDMDSYPFIGRDVCSSYEGEFYTARCKDHSSLKTGQVIKLYMYVNPKKVNIQK